MVGAERFQIIWVNGVRPSDQIKLHGWLVFRCGEGEERILSAKKERSSIKSSQKKALSLANRGNGHFCLHAIVKPRMFPSNIGKKTVPK